MVALDKALYSASVLERATAFCFLELQVIKFPQRNTHIPLIDFLSSMFVAQSESEYPSRVNKEAGLNNRP